MKILHTSDWHLGHRLYDLPQYFEQQKFLEWLITVINNESIDVLLVSGDIYDTGYPSAQSQELFFHFLADLYKNTSCKEVVITAGNHDAPGTINAPDSFVRNFSINLIGKATENITDEILTFDIGNEKLIVAAVPFLRDRDIRKATAGEDATDIEQRYRKALTNHYNEIAENINNKNINNAFTIAMGHLFAIGGEASDSENRIYVGGLGDMSATDFPEVFDYVALGHLHRSQKVNGNKHIRYSGSPYAMGFDESESIKNVIIVTTKSSKLLSVDELEIPIFRKLFSLTGTLEYCKNEIDHIVMQNFNPEPWIEVNINEPGLSTNAYTIINEYISNKDIKALKVRNISLQKNTDITMIEEEDRKLNELNPLDVFINKCKESDFDIENNTPVLKAFEEILIQIETSSDNSE